MKQSEHLTRNVKNVLYRIGTFGEKIVHIKYY